MVDLAQIQREADEISLKKAIRTHDLGTVAACLRRLGGQIPPDIVNELADYLDPAIENRRYPEGPKPRKKRSWMFRNAIIDTYHWLCNDLEYAWFVLNRDEEAFFLVENTEPLDADGNFSPQWKYPYSNRRRETFQSPNRGEIKTLVCEMYNIGSRTFDDLLAAYRK